jgi:hypothetical protein
LKAEALGKPVFQRDALDDIAVDGDLDDAIGNRAGDQSMGLYRRQSEATWPLPTASGRPHNAARQRARQATVPDLSSAALFEFVCHALSYGAF